MRVLAISPEELWLDLEGVAHETALRELTMYKIGRKVEIADATGERTVLSVIGPRAWDALSRAGHRAGPAARARARVGSRATATRSWRPPTSGSTCSRRRPRATDADGRPRGRRRRAVSARAAELVRIERGRPRYGVDMSDENLPGEAGIVERAVSFTKGCYVGQEPVARMFHKGHPNRHLRVLLLSAPVEPGTPVTAAGKEVGRITSAGVSPVHGPIALAILRREVAPGDEVTAGTATRRSSSRRSDGRRIRPLVEARNAGTRERRRRLTSDSPLLGGQVAAEAGDEEAVRARIRIRRGRRRLPAPRRPSRMPSRRRCATSPA